MTLQREVHGNARVWKGIVEADVIDAEQMAQCLYVRAILWRRVGHNFEKCFMHMIWILRGRMHPNATIESDVHRVRVVHLRPIRIKSFKFT